MRLRSILIRTAEDVVQIQKGLIQGVSSDSTINQKDIFAELKNSVSMSYSYLEKEFICTKFIWNYFVDILNNNSPHTSNETSSSKSQCMGDPTQQSSGIVTEQLNKNTWLTEAVSGAVGLSLSTRDLLLRKELIHPKPSEVTGEQMTEQQKQPKINSSVLSPGTLKMYSMGFDGLSDCEDSDATPPVHRHTTRSIVRKKLDTESEEAKSDHATRLERRSSNLKSKRRGDDPIALPEIRKRRPVTRRQKRQPWI